MVEQGPLRSAAVIEVLPVAVEHAADFLLAQQPGDRQQAWERLVAEATVKTYLSRIFGKLGVDDRTAAVTTALERQLIELRPPDGAQPA